MVNAITKIILICVGIFFIMFFASFLFAIAIGKYIALVLALLILEIVLVVGIIKGIKNKCIRGFDGRMHYLKKQPGLYYFHLIGAIIIFLSILFGIIYMTPQQLLKVPIGSFP